MRFQHVPVEVGGRTYLVVADDTEAQLKSLRQHDDKEPVFVRIPRKLVALASQSYWRRELLHQATRQLATTQPEFSAAKVITRRQCWFLALVAAAAVLAVTMTGNATLAIVSTLSVFFVANGFFRALLVIVGSLPRNKQSDSTAPNRQSLPIYSILVPLYREARVLPTLLKALLALDYPKEKLDILFVVEADDANTAAAAEAADIDPRFTVIRVPPCQPRTKPKACNYALPFARGEFSVIFDAEDRPEPDQLLKAVAAFRAYTTDVVCLQARLEFFNRRDGWIPLMSALDYLLWFCCLLPGLDRLGIPMPLGGTSNHFRTSALREIGAWDPYNVTEDADLGIRFARLGLRVRTLDSTTYEEAVVGFGAWIRQRSRWMKGYMQTWLVHMRDPSALVRHAGWRGFIGFQLFIGGTVLCALANPILWTVFLWANFFAAPEANHLASHISLSALVAGNGLFAYLATFMPTRRGWFSIVPYGLTAPFYWCMISIAAIRALYQLCTNPWHWDKTEHGTSKQVFQNGL